MYESHEDTIPYLPSNKFRPLLRFTDKLPPTRIRLDATALRYNTTLSIVDRHPQSIVSSHRRGVVTNCIKDNRE